MRELYVYWIQKDTHRHVYLLIIVLVLLVVSTLVLHVHLRPSSSMSSSSILFSFFLFLCHSFFNYLILNWREKRLISWEELYVYWIWQNTRRNIHIIIVVSPPLSRWSVTIDSYCDTLIPSLCAVVSIRFSSLSGVASISNSPFHWAKFIYF